MTGYVIEKEDGIEDELSAVMVNVNWHEWKPIHLADSLALTDKLVKQARLFLETTEETRISSRRLKEVLGLGNVAPMTWTRVVRQVVQDYENETTPDLLRILSYGVVCWKLEGQSLVKQTPELLGFSVEVALAAPEKALKWSA